MQNISLINLSYSLLPLIIVGYFYYKYTGNKSEILYSTFRMISQLLIIGYFLVYIFENKNYILGLGILIFILLVSSIIIMRNTKNKSFKHYGIILFSN